MGLRRRWRSRSDTDGFEFQDVERSMFVEAPAGDVWELISDADQFHRTAHADHLWTSVALGTPTGQVGERRVTLWQLPDGHVTTSLVERTEMVPGHRLVTRELTLP